MNDNRMVFALAGATIFLWGLWGFFGKLALDHGMPPLSIFIVEVIASLAIVLIVIFLRQGVKHTPDVWNWRGVVSGLTLALGLLSYYLALSRGQASIVVPLTAAYPAVAAILSFAFLHERPTMLQWAGVIFVACGAVLLLSGPIGSPGAR
jgi:transporter family protein